MVQVVCLSFFKFLKLNEFVIDRILEGNIERFELLVMFDDLNFFILFLGVLLVIDLFDFESLEEFK